MNTILFEIIEKKKKNIERQKKKVELKNLQDRVFSLYHQVQHDNTFKNAILDTNDMAIIAEIKLASPTIPSLGSENKILQRAVEYEKAGANIISFITEQYYFKGNIKFISLIKHATHIPVLQKDFVIDEYQIYEAKITESNALLLIVRYLDVDTIKKFVDLCLEINIEPVVEINSENDLKKAIQTKTNIIAVNARNLEDFSVDVDEACILMKKIPKKLIKLGFSGIHSSLEVQKYKNAGAKGVLIGTELMKTNNIKKFIQDLKKI